LMNVGYPFKFFVSSGDSSKSPSYLSVPVCRRVTDCLNVP
jgi:hypothetical protein